MGKEEQLLSPGRSSRSSCSRIYTWQALMRKNTNVVHAKDDDHNTLAKVLGAIDLISYGVGATVGAGIFVTVGIVAKDIAGPGILLSFLFAAIACLLSAFCYSEFAANIPVSGSAYTFSYVALGEFVGWFIGWNLTLEYTISASAVARGWGGYVATLFQSFGVTIPNWLVNYKLNSLFNLSALSVVIIVICGIILLFGVKDSARFNLIITILNVCTILFIVGLGAFHVDLKNWDPFLPYGVSGAFAGAGTVFFSYIGFDSVSSLAGEVRRPGRDLPIGIVGTLVIATVLYIAVSLVVTGMVKYHELNVDAPLSVAFEDIGLHWASIIIGVGSVTALTATTLCSLLGQPRIFFQMAKDGLLPPRFGVVNPKTQAPVFGTVVTCVAASVLAFILDLNTLANMISIGTLLAFTVVCAGVIIMRLDDDGINAVKMDKDADAYLLHKGARRSVVSRIPVPVLLVVFFLASGWLALIYKYDWPTWTYSFPATIMFIIYIIFQLRRQVNIPTTFTCPLVPLIPLLGMMVNTFLIMQLPLDAVKRVGVWSAVGFIIYFGYGIRNSKLNDECDNVSSRGRDDSSGINGE